MTRGRGKVTLATVLMLTAALVAACASKSSTPAADTLPPRPDAGLCTTSCCELPTPNSACMLEAGAMCSYAATCPEGLVISRTTTCTSGVWMVTNDCPQPGGVDPTGCPSAQPTPNTPCALDAGFGPAQCSYGKSCAATVCDGSDCQHVQASATATCVMGMWKTTPLGPC